MQLPDVQASVEYCAARLVVLCISAFFRSVSATAGETWRALIDIANRRRCTSVLLGEGQDDRKRKPEAGSGNSRYYWQSDAGANGCLHAPADACARSAERQSIPDRDRARRHREDGGGGRGRIRRPDEPRPVGPSLLAGNDVGPHAFGVE